MASDQILNKARAKHEAGQHGEAIKLYQMVLIKEPGNLDANYLLGTVYAEIGKLEQALKYLLRAEKILPSSPFIKVNIGNVFKEQGNYEEAILCFLSALHIQNDLVEAQNNLSVVSQMLEGKAEKSAVSCLEYALTCIEEARNSDALSIMKIGNQLDSDNIHIRYLLTILEGNQPDKELQEQFDNLESDEKTEG